MAIEIDKGKESEDFCNWENRTCAYFGFEGDVGENKEYIWLMSTLQESKHSKEFQAIDRK